METAYIQVNFWMFYYVQSWHITLNFAFMCYVLRILRFDHLPNLLCSFMLSNVTNFHSIADEKSWMLILLILIYSQIEVHIIRIKCNGKLKFAPDHFCIIHSSIINHFAIYWILHTCSITTPMLTLFNYSNKYVNYSQFYL